MAAPSTIPTPDVTAELTDYSQHIPYATENAYQWWHDDYSVYPRLYELALDVLSAPASEAYMERIFSVSGDLSAGKRNWAEMSLQKRVFLKLNKKLWTLPLIEENEHYKQASQGLFLPDDIETETQSYLLYN